MIDVYSRSLFIQETCLCFSDCEIVQARVCVCKPSRSLRSIAKTIAEFDQEGVNRNRGHIDKQ